MQNILQMNTFISILILCCMPVAVLATPPSLIYDEKGKELAKDAIHDIYNYDYDKADKSIALLEETWSEHPGYTMLHVLKYHAKTLYSFESNEVAPEYVSLLKKAIEQSEEWVDASDGEPEAMFFALISHAYLALYYSENGKLMKAVDQSKKAYKYMKKGFELKEEYAEFYLTTGLYYFYREQYPETKPAVKSFMWFFSSGDKEEGIANLKQSVEKSTFTKPEALTYLNHIYLKYIPDPEKAVLYGKKMHEEFPGNPFFLCKYTEALLMKGEFEAASTGINKLLVQDNDYFKMTGFLFKAYQEEHTGNQDKAFKLYKKAVSMCKRDESLTYDYLGMSYAGMARIADNKGKEEKAINYYKLSKKHSEYVDVNEEASAYLDQHE